MYGNWKSDHKAIRIGFLTIISLVILLICGGFLTSVFG